MKSIKDIIAEHQMVLNKREELNRLFNMIADCHITVGGSYMLRYWCEDFFDREVSDYDFILHGEEKDIDKIKRFLGTLSHSTGMITFKYYDNVSFYLGYLNGKKVNIILSTEHHCKCSIFESIEDIINIKRKWADKAISEGRKPRMKDIADITIYENWKAQNDDLPF